MTNKISPFLCLLFSILLFGGCSNDDNTNSEVISTSEFVLNTPYVWKVSKESKDVFLIINSEEELSSYVQTPP